MSELSKHIIRSVIGMCCGPLRYDILESKHIAYAGFYPKAKITAVKLIFCEQKERAAHFAIDCFTTSVYVFGVTYRNKQQLFVSSGRCRETFRNKFIALS